MILSLIFWGVTSFAAPDCTQMTISGGGFEVKVNGVLFSKKGEEKKFCLRLPEATLKPFQNPYVEWSSINKGNASCGVLKMRILRPNKPDINGNESDRTCNSKGVQPGCMMPYTQGQWVATYTLIEPCRPGEDRWDLGVKWSVK